LLLKKLPPWDLIGLCSDGRYLLVGVVLWKEQEDPYLEPNCYRPVKGFQGDDLKARNTILACAKHFAGWFCRSWKRL
jgi:beta-glucosidase